jgi:hypothetical protein
MTLHLLKFVPGGLRTVTSDRGRARRRAHPVPEVRVGARASDT